MDLTGKKIFGNHTVFSYIGKVKVKKTLEGHFIFDKTGFDFKKNLANKGQDIYSRSDIFPLQYPSYLCCCRKPRHHLCDIF